FLLVSAFPYHADLTSLQYHGSLPQCGAACAAPCFLASNGPRHDGGDHPCPSLVYRVNHGGQPPAARTMGGNRGDDQCAAGFAVVRVVLPQIHHRDCCSGDAYHPPHGGEGNGLTHECSQLACQGRDHVVEPLGHCG